MKGGPIRFFANARRADPRPSIRGFTLLELMIVVVIILIMTAMAIPLVNNVSKLLSAAWRSFFSDRRDTVNALPGDLPGMSLSVRVWTM